tara:strand:+ start:213 stop:413 length:201 start_codon:yes stop_codon:yes gene_type:complete
MKKITLLTLSLYLLLTQPSLAYLDPGSGSAIISMIIGFFVAIGVIIKTFWYKIKSIFEFSKNKEKE